MESNPPLSAHDDQSSSAVDTQREAGRARMKDLAAKHSRTTLGGLGKRLLGVSKMVVSVGLVAYLLIFQTDLKQLWQAARQARYAYLMAALALMIIGTALRAVRWRVLLQALEIEVPLRRLVRLYFVGSFFNLFLPSGLGGDAVKMAELARYTGRAPEAIGTTLVDRASGLWVLFVLALGALPFSHPLLPQGWGPIIALVTAAGAVGGWLIMGTPLIPWIGNSVQLPAQNKLQRFYGSVSRLGYAALGRACAVSLVFDSLLILFNVIVARSFAVDTPLQIFFLFTPIISLSLVLPLSIGGLGVREQTYVLLFGPLGISSDIAIAMALANYALTNVAVGLLGGLLYALEGTEELRFQGG